MKQTKFQTFQWKFFRILINAPWYVSYSTIHKDLNAPQVTETTITPKIQTLKCRLQQLPFAELYNQPPTLRRQKRQLRVNLFSKLIVLINKHRHLIDTAKLKTEDRKLIQVILLYGLQKFYLYL